MHSVTQPSGSNGINISVLLFYAPAGFGFVLWEATHWTRLDYALSYINALTLVNFSHYLLQYRFQFPEWFRMLLYPARESRKNIIDITRNFRSCETKN